MVGSPSEHSPCTMVEATLTHRDYTVGWICALEVEQAAARAAFDEEHPMLPSILGDPNKYRFGSIAGHNVVVACLPNGEMGSNPAATVATRMTINFPSMKFGLMVGIGGGVPQPPNFDDIRLGDVVVSSSTSDNGGVVQYDRGKTVQGGDFKQTGSLNAPPEVLRQAVTDLRATYRLEGGKLAEHLAQMVLEYRTFASPATTLGLQDTLFRSDYEHPEGPGFPTCESCDAAQIVQRPPKSPTPVVHYGIIASGNQVMRNGLKRDEISKKLGGVLCFEMEAAGLMNLFPCIVIRGICDYSDSHKNKKWQAYAAATAAAYTKELLGEVEPAKVDKTQAAAEVMTILKAPWLVPFERNPHFVGRDSQVKELEEKLSSKDICRRVAIFGLGGIGKTQIALEYAYHVREKSPSCAIFWIPAITTASIEQAYQEIAKLLQNPGIREEKVDVKQFVQSRLSDESFGEWLLIIDNADDADILLRQSTGSDSLRLIDYLPVSPKGSVIFTTRTRKAAIDYGQVDVIEVINMDLVDSKKVLENYVLRKHILGENEAVIQLLELLTYLPLAIVQAVAYINKNDISISEYIDLYNNGNEKDIIEILSENFEDRGRYKGMENPIATTWLISYEQIRRRDPLAVEYLSFMACLMRENIPKSLLLPGLSKKREIDALGTLTAYSFIAKQETQVFETADPSMAKEGREQFFSMHRLVYLATRNWLRNQSQLSIWVDKALIRLLDVLPASGHQGLKKWAAYIPHAIYVVASFDISDIEVQIDLVGRIGWCQYNIGQYRAAETSYRQKLEMRMKASEKEHPDTLMGMNDLAGMLGEQGKYTEAEQMHRRVSQLHEKVLGMEHPDTLRTMDNLAGVLGKQGKYTEAEQMHRQVLQLHENALGMEHPNTLRTMNNIAVVLREQGKYPESEQIHQRVLQLHEKVLGMEHPDTLSSMNNLATVLGRQGKYTEAEQIYQQALQLREKVLGMEHPDTLSSMNNLATVLGGQGKYTEAEQMHQQVLQLQEKVLGIKNPDTLLSMNNLAVVLGEQGKYTEAEQMLQQVLQLREKVLGMEHPETLSSINNLATVLGEQGRYTEAEQIYQQALQLHEKVLGAEHPDTLNTIYCLALLLHKQRQYDESSIL